MRRDNFDKPCCGKEGSSATRRPGVGPPQRHNPELPTKPVPPFCAGLGLTTPLPVRTDVLRYRFSSCGQLTPACRFAVFITGHGRTDWPRRIAS